MTNKLPLIRFPLWLVLANCFVGCNNPKKETHTITVETFEQSELSYPDSAVVISKATRAAFLNNFFVTWNKSSEQLLDSLNPFPGKELTYLSQYMGDDEWYGENKKPHKKWQRQAIVNNVDTTSFPNFLKKGLIVAHTNLRRIPTNRPGFDSYSKAGEGFPFDYFQETNLWINTPLQLVHLTNDKQWCYVISPYYKGWVQMKDIGVVSDEFMEDWLTGTYAMPLFDGVNLKDSNSMYAVNAKLGALLPCVPVQNGLDSIMVYYANADENQNAKILKAIIPKDQVALSDFEFNRVNLQQLVSNLIGRPYGWGGNLENRDCSSMIRDLMATYQVWLPRDSKDQMEIGKVYELADTREEKMQLIQEKGIPFQTILRKKGHNMLYVGNADNGEPLIFHAIWGLKTTYSDTELAKFLSQYPIEGIHLEEDGTLKGRHIIGEAVITSVMAGQGNTDVTIPLIDEIYAMTNILGE